MKAIMFREYGPAEVLEVAEVPAPRIAAADELLIDVHAASVIPGDTKLRAGVLRHMFEISLPKILGRDGAGVVREVGAGVEGFAPGDRAVFFAMHAEAGCQSGQVVRPEESVVRLPDNLSFVEAAALTHSGICAWLGLHDTLGIGPGQTVLIQGGAGAIGGVCVQLAAMAGARVLATCSARNIDTVRGLGADAAFAYDGADVVAEILAAEGKVDAVYDLVGGKVHGQSCRLLKPGGRLAWLVAEPFEDESADHGVRCDRVVVRDDRAVLQAVMDVAAEGRLKPWVAAEIRPDEIAAAHRRIEAGEVSRGRLVLTFDDTDR